MKLNESGMMKNESGSFFNEYAILLSQTRRKYVADSFSVCRIRLLSGRIHLLRPRTKWIRHVNKWIRHNGKWILSQKRKEAPIFVADSFRRVPDSYWNMADSVKNHEYGMSVNE